jgi:hypothetical protein
MSQRLERAEAVWTRPAISIQASGPVNGRTNRPDTRKHLNLSAIASTKTSCIRRGVHTRTLLGRSARDCSRPFTDMSVKDDGSTSCPAASPPQRGRCRSRFSDRVVVMSTWLGHQVRIR